MSYIEAILYFMFNFFVYGFIGWIIENVYSYYKVGHIQEDGFLNSPFKPMYAIAMAVLVLIDNIFKLNIFMLMVLCFIVPTTVEYLTGIIMRNYFNKDYWDYSKEKNNIDGIVCLRFSIYWTFLTIIGVRYFQVYIINKLYSVITKYWIAVCPVLVLMLIVDDVITIRALKNKKEVL